MCYTAFLRFAVQISQLFLNIRLYLSNFLWFGCEFNNFLPFGSSFYCMGHLNVSDVIPAATRGVGL